MDIGDWVSSAEMNNTFRKARSLDLESNLLELEVFGFTIIEPEKAAPAGLAERLLEATLALIEREDPAHVALNTYEKSAVDGRHLFHLPLKDPAFAEALMNPVVMTLARYTTGQLGRLHATVGFVKSEIGKPTRLHCDATGVTAPMPPYGTFVNISYILTDYTEASGTLAIVPGSNRWCRPPTPIEQPKCLGGVNDDICIPVIAKPGSIVVFGGNTWHGAYPKKEKGLRAHLSYGFSRSFVLPAEIYDDVPDEMIEQYGPEFAQLMGKYADRGWAHSHLHRRQHNSYREPGGQYLSAQLRSRAQSL
jgi:ectoine hydroxylase-related dioxygenase (phytanoyl-CoA dioxygenase family)